MCKLRLWCWCAAVLLSFVGTGLLLGAEFNPARLERLATEEMQSSRTPGAVVAIVRRGELVWSKGLGLANVETQQPVTPDMLFRLGSTTKMFTAAALLSFANEGRLKMHEPVEACISALHPSIAALTPHQLLTHSAGLTDESVMDGLHDDAALAAGIRAMDASWLFTAPGKIYSYANPGYWIAGLACEELAAKPYAEVMSERLFRPLGMSRTSLHHAQAMTWPLALGHEVRGGKPAIVRPQADNAATRPAGQMYSNAADISRFLSALMNGGHLDGEQILPAAVVTQMTTPYVARPGNDGQYGYGLTISDQRGVKLWQHSGSRTGYGSLIQMAPEHQTAVIILTNRSSSSLPKTAAAALDMLLPFSLPKAESAREPKPLSAAEMNELAGLYSNNRQTIKLTIEDGQLMARRRGGSTAGTARQLLRAGNNRLAIVSRESEENADPAMASYIVVRDSAGRPEYLCSSGRAFRRQEAEPAKPQAGAQKK